MTDTTNRAGLVNISGGNKANGFKPVALVSMPTLSGRFPSFQLALLKPTLERAGIPAQAFSLFMYFGTHIGWRINEAIADVWPSMVGEWIWTKAAFGDEVESDRDEYFRQYERIFRAICDRAGCTIEDIRRIRNESTISFIDFCVNSIDWSRFGLIGFSVVFQQLLSSVALAKALKSRYPDIPIVMGGAGFEDDIADEIMRNCPQVDYLHCGDAELSFPEMVRRLYKGESMRDLKGIMWRDGGEVIYAGRAPNFSDMNSTPIPDFDEYFYARRESSYIDYEGARQVLLPIETARGCWWGEKNHCTFCGLNRSGMEFRAKDADNVIEQIEALTRRYGIFHFNAIDNILAPEYSSKLFGRLAEANTDIRLHYEVRPSISRAQLKEMRKGGLFSVQPGVESLSTNILKIMRKHTTGMRNLELIKWCTYYGIHNFYNILVRFPGETAEDYRLQSEVISKISHLQPPYAIVKARADRGSPMYFEPEAQSITSLRPAACYDFIFPKDRFNLERVSYYFDHQMENTVTDEQYREIFGLVAAWQESWEDGEKPYLRYRKSLATIVIEDGRGPRPRSFTYSDGAASLYEYCADARKPADVAARFRDEEWVEGALSDFVGKDLMIFLDGRYLSLALPENPYF
ncbi:MAG TPA: RiPP maturation radical SAM C-methyltransferase [Blastocatellia bacterium]|nr:RiPP maturation radical SAM C-methyltransferase [Blastocatellia bacterium]